MPKAEVKIAPSEVKIVLNLQQENIVDVRSQIKMSTLETLSRLDLTGICTPAFLVDMDVAKRNASKMRERCDKLKVNLRPHMKTHKTLQFGELMTAGRKRCIVVSTLAEAEFYADGGFDDILLAVPFAWDKIPRMQALSERLTSFHVLLDSHAALDVLLSNRLSNHKPWSIYLKIDCGNNRAGVLWDSIAGLDLAKRLHQDDSVTFQGVYAHDGNSYYSQGEQQIHDVGNRTADRLIAFSHRLEEENIPCPVVATGSTPSCSKPGTSMSLVTEFHPGNYIFYDMQQHLIGSCDVEEIAGVVATRVIGTYPHRNQLLIDCGWTGLSLDGNAQMPGKSFCLIVGEPNLALTKMTQETGFISAIEDKIDFDKFPIGRVLYLAPYHVCATAAMHPVYHIHNGGRFVDRFEPCRGW